MVQLDFFLLTPLFDISDPFFRFPSLQVLYTAIYPCEPRSLGSVAISKAGPDRSLTTFFWFSKSFIRNQPQVF